MILDDDEEEVMMKVMDEGEEDILQGTEVDVCLNALSSQLQRNTITLFGVIKNQPLRILIDTGSTHSYVHNQFSNFGAKTEGDTRIGGHLSRWQEGY